MCAFIYVYVYTRVCNHVCMYAWLFICIHAYVMHVCWQLLQVHALCILPVCPYIESHAPFRVLHRPRVMTCACWHTTGQFQGSGLRRCPESHRFCHNFCPRFGQVIMTFTKHDLDSHQDRSDWRVIILTRDCSLSSSRASVAETPDWAHSQLRPVSFNRCTKPIFALLQP